MYPTILCGRMPQHSVFELMTITSGVHSFVQAHSFHYYGLSPTSLVVPTKRSPRGLLFLYPTILCGRMPQHSVFELMTITSGVHSLVQAHSFHYYGLSPTSLIVSTKRTWNYCFRFFYAQNGRDACINDDVRIKKQTAEQCVWWESQWRRQDDGESHPTCCPMTVELAMQNAGYCIGKILRVLMQWWVG